MTLVGTATGREGYWQGDVSTDWNTAGNWFVVGAPGDGGFVPQSSSGFNVRAVIGTDNPNGALNSTLGNSPVISSALPTAKATIGGLYFGVRQRDFTFNPPQFVNPQPAQGALVGALTISGGTLNNVSTSEAGIGADGRIVVGADGRGFLTMTGGTLTGQQLVVAGENFTGDALGSSMLDLSGSSTLTVNGTSTFSRRLRVAGPSVNLSSSLQLELESTNTYTAAITSATSHSPLKVTSFGESAVVDGTLNIQFSGAAATRDPIASLGTKWTLIDVNTPDLAKIDGNFSNVASDGTIAVSGLDAAHSAPLGAQYAIRKRISDDSNRALLELSYEAVLILTVNRDTGEMSIRNPYGGEIAIDAYSVASANGSMVTSFAGLGTTTPGAGDWVKPGGNNPNILSEVKLPDQTPPIGNDDAYNLTAVPAVSLGVGFDKFAVASDVANFGDDGEDLVFLYGGPDTDDAPIRGHIEYIGSKFENNLVLRVNPNTGAATLKNDSLETLVFDGFTIASDNAALSAAGFTPVSGGSGAWLVDAEGSVGLSQVNFTGARTLAPGDEVSIGDISAAANPFQSAAAQAGLSMQFILAQGLESGAAAGDYNEDGEVNAADYTVWRDNLGASITLPNENPAASTPGVVDAEDYAFWRIQYGMTGGSAPETEFRIGSVFFDPTLLGGSLSAASAAPEPAALLLLAAGCGALVLGRRRACLGSAQGEGTEQTLRQTSETGVFTMIGRHAVLATLACVVVAGAWRSADAATTGIPIVNFDMELPGPTGSKVVAFDELGAPIAGIIPGWTFTGPGTTLWSDDVPGDSGTEGGGNPGNALLLNTNDGKVYQTVSGHSIVNPMANQQYRVSFDAWEIFSTYSDPNTELANGFRLTSRLYYGAYPGTTLMTQEVFGGTGATNYEFLIPHNDPLLTPGAIGQSLGIEFDTTSVEYSINEDPLNEIRDIEESWAHIDNVVFEIVGIQSGDLNGDGLVNLSDASNLVANLQRYTPFEAEGELTGDNVVDLNDFRVLKGLIAAGSLTAGLENHNLSVPEPSAGLLLVFCLTLGGVGFAYGRPRRRHAYVLAAAAVLLVSPIRESQAAVLAYDPFLIGGNAAAGQYTETTFTTGDPPVAINPLAGQNPTIGPTPFFAGPWVIGSEGQVVQSTGLSYLGTPSQGGAASGYGRTDRFFAEQWTETTVGTYYIGVQANFGSTPDANMGYRAIEFFPPNVTPGENRVGDIGYNQFFSSFGAPQQNPATAKMQFNIGGQQIIGPAPSSYNEDGLTHLLVLKFELSADPMSDRVSLYFDPKTPIEPASPSNMVEGFDFTLGAIGLASFGNVGPTTVLDEIRVATTFEDVLPPDLPIPGDCNGDKVVDFLDYQCIIDNMNLPGGQTLSQGDVNGDGKTTIADYRFWKERRTDLSVLAAVSGDGSGVPEPSSLGIASLLGLLAAGSRLRRAR